MFKTKADLKNILTQLPVYDDIHLLWMENEWVYFYELIREKSKHLILNIGGSDFYRAGNAERNCKKKLITCADRVMAQTPETASRFIAYYGSKVEEKIRILPYGVEVLDYIRQQIGRAHV